MMTLGPTLFVQDSRGAVAFYCEAFRMTIGYHAFHPDGTYLHVELERGGCTIFAVSESSDAAIRTAMIALFHRRAVSHFMSSLVYVSGKGPDVEVGDGLPLLGRGVAHDGALSEVQLSEHRMNLRVTEFCSGGESRKRESGAGGRFGLREFAVFADRGPHDKGVPPLHRGLLFRSRGKYSVSACRGGADVRSSPLQSAPIGF